MQFGAIVGIAYLVSMAFKLVIAPNFPKPFLIAYLETMRMSTARCEARQDLPNFFTDRLQTSAFLDERFRRPSAENWR